MLSFQTIQPDRIPEDIQAHPFSLSRDELNKASRIDLGRAYLVCYRPGYRSKMTTLGLLVPAAIQDRVFSMERRHNWNHRGAKAIRRCDCEATIEFLRIALANGVPSPTFVAPSPKGKVSLSWRIGPNLVYAEVSAKDKDHLYFQWGGPTDETKEGVIGTREFINRLLRLVARG